jgi:hypothetical protein
MQEQAVVITNTLFFWPWPPINSLDGLLEHFLNIPPKALYSKLQASL